MFHFCLFCDHHRTLADCWGYFKAKCSSTGVKPLLVIHTTTTMTAPMMVMSTSTTTNTFSF